MNALVFLLIPATIGVDFGWERQPDNSIEYILQIEPEALDSMKTGTELISTLPPQLRNIRDYRIRVGRDPLPNQGKIPPEIGAATTAQPNIASNNYPPANNFNQPNNYTQPNNYATTNNYPQSTTPGAYPAGSYPTNSYPPATNNSFVNNSTAPTYNPNAPYGNTTATNNTGMSPIGTPTVPTSTSGFPLQTANATYPTNPAYPNNTSGQTLANLPPPPSTYPNNYANPYPAGSATPAGYNPQGYNPNAVAGTNPYGTNPYAQNNYAPNNYAPNNFAQGSYPPPTYPNPAFPNQQYQPPTNPYAYPQPQYLAMNGGPLPAGYGAAKPTLNDPAGTAGNFPNGTQFTQPGATNTGLPPLNPNLNTAGLGTNPATLPANGLNPGALNGGNLPNNSFVNAGNTNIDPHTGLPTGQVATKEPQSQWASLGFALVALFASIGANIYIGWQNHYLRERCRMLVADRAAY